MKVTALKIQVRNKSRVNVYLDGKFAFGLTKVVAAQLAIGQELDEAAITHLRGLDNVEQAYERALRFLGPRPRSEVEVRRRLREHEVPPETIDAVVARLGRAGLINDEAFANYWVENRVTFRPRSKRVLRAELKLKGVGEETLRQALEAADDETAAYTLAVQRARRLKGLDYQTFRRKMGEFLGRRGFNFDTIGPIVERVWKEIDDNDSESSDTAE